MPCPQRAAGCPFVGTRQQLEEHRRTCALEAISPFIAKYSAQQEDLRRELQAARREFEESEARQASRIRRLEERLEAQEAHTRQLLALQEDAQRQLQDLLTQLAHLRAALAAAAPAAKATLVAAAGPAVGGKAEELALAGLSEGVPGSTGTNAQYKCIGTFNGHTGPVWCLVVNAEQKVLVSGSSDQTVKVWDIATFKVKRTFHGHEGIVHAVASHGRLIFSGSSDKTIKIWSLDKPKQTELLGTVTSHENTVCALLVAGGLLFSGSYQQVRIHDLESLECVHTLTGHNHWVRAIQCSGQLLYTASYNSIKIWDIKTFECRRTVPAHHGSIYCLAFIGQQYLACATYENAVAIYRLLPDSQLEFFQELKGHSGAVYACCVSGSRLFSGSYDYTIKVWDIDTWYGLLTSILVYLLHLPTPCVCACVRACAGRHSKYTSTLLLLAFLYGFNPPHLCV
jgi:E3 ubiquitin-protein ligase TRAF7